MLGQWVTPWVLLALFILMVRFYQIGLEEKPKTQKIGLGNRGFLYIIGIAILLFLIALYLGFKIFPDPYTMSDVIGQIEFQGRMWLAGETPYQPDTEIKHRPFPVYMPFHWMPFVVSQLVGMDSRIWAIIILSLTVLLLWMYRWSKVDVMTRSLLVITTFLACAIYFLFARYDMMCTLELLIMAYYLILAYGLLQHDKRMIFFGILTCLLSRYTLIFWLPLVFWVFYHSGMKRYAWQLTIGSVVGLLVFYVFPFLVPNPSAFKDGLAYHQSAALVEWIGFDGHVYIMEKGVFFANYFDAILPGPKEEKVIMMRYIQAIGLLLTLSIALLRWKKTKLELYDFLLLYLFIFIAEFFLFGTLTYSYYYICLAGIAAVLTIRVFRHEYVG